MNKRFLSAALAIVLCFAVCVTSFADVTLSGIKDMTAGDAKEKAVSFIEAQFGAMTDEQLEVLSNALAKYEEDATQAAIKESIDENVRELIGADVNDVYYTNETLKDAYKWKLMRDIMEEKIDVSIPGDEYVAWLAEFTAFETANDDSISVKNPRAAFNSLGSYSKDLTTRFNSLAAIAKNADFVVEGEDAEKAVIYSKKSISEYTGEPLNAEDQAEFDKYLEEDVIEMADEVAFNIVDIAVRVLLNDLQPGDSIIEKFEVKSLKESYLLAGDDLANKVMDSQDAFSGAFDELDMNEVTNKLVGAGVANVLSGDNESAVSAIYKVAKALSDYAVSLPTVADFVSEFEEKLGFTYSAHVDSIVSDVKAAMNLISEVPGGVELIHLNTYLGRAMLNPAANTTITLTAGDEDQALELSLTHSAEKVQSIIDALKSKNISLGEFAVVAPEGSSVTAEPLTDEDGYAITGQFLLGAKNAASGDEATLTVYRGSSDEYSSDEDVYRYVSIYNAKVTGEEETEPSTEATEPSTEPTTPSEPVVENPYVTLDSIADTTANGTVTIKGTTNLPYVTVLVTLADEDSKVYSIVLSKDEFEAGKTIKVPAGAEPGYVYTVIAGTEKAQDTTTFKIIGETSEDSVVLEEIADTTVDGTVTIKGTTTLPYVTVLVTKAEATENIYAIVLSKAEFEAGKTIKVPAGAAVGDEYTVIVGTAKATDDKSFKIVEENVPTEPTTEATEPSTEATEPSTEATEPTTEATEPSTEATTAPTEPATELPTLAIAGKETRSVSKGSTITITSTPQSAPDGSYVTWTVADSDIASVTNTTGDYGNIATIKGLKKGSTTVTATLYDKDGNVLDTKEITVKVTTGGGGGGSSTSATTATEQPTQSGSSHECEWPDIAAANGKDAHWAHETIDIMTINGYISGYPDGTFKPDGEITRAEFATIVYRILGLRQAEDGILYDDTVGHWSEGIVATMSLPEGYGMLRGYGDGNFGPDDVITREQAIAIIARAKSSVWTAATEGAKDSFSDSESISWWFDSEIDSAVTNGLVTGYEDGSFRPLQTTTRAEACVLLARAWPEVLETESTSVE
jgi:hypothetical protein